jgi:hypothetical protein
MIIETIGVNKVISDHSANIGRKLAFADDIISIFMPLFSEEIDRKKRILENTKEDYQHLKQVIAEGKNTLKKINFALKKERLVRAILIEINKMTSTDVLYGNNKQIVINLLSNIETLDVDDLVGELDKLRKLLSKK